MSSEKGMSEKVYQALPIGIQNIIVSFIGAKRLRHENGRTFQQLVKQLLKMQYYNKDQIESYTENRIRKVLLAAKNTDYYENKLPSVQEISKTPLPVLKDIPVLDKEEVRKNFRAFINREYRDELIQHGTSGTTGMPLQVIWTKESMDMERALIWRQRLETGTHIGKIWRGMLGGHQIVPIKQNKPPYWRINRGAKQVYLSTYHLCPQAAADYRDAFEKFGIKILEGYPSTLYALASILEREKLSYPLEGVYYGAEALHDYQREVIERVFSCYVWDYYGLTERVASASEFRCRSGLHENWENCFLEIVNSSGNPVPAGEYGELAGTSLSNLAFPLLRYRSGDMTAFIQGECSCDRNSRKIARIDTKREDLLLMPNGTLLSASNLTYPFKQIEHIQESQLYQKTPDILEVRIVPSDSYLESDGQSLINAMNKLVPDSVSVVLKKVSRIPRTAAGKFRFCISEITNQN